MSDDLNFVVSAGHDEYVLPLESGISCIWSYDYDDDVDGSYGDAWEQKLHDRYVAKNGSEPGDYDLGWERIYRVAAPRLVVRQALERLIADLDTDLGADDDTFDYWPSGVRLARDVADQLGGSWPGVVEEMARSVIAEQREAYADELIDKCGYGGR